MLKQNRKILVCLHALIEKMKRKYVKYYNLKYERTGTPSEMNTFMFVYFDPNK